MADDLESIQKAEEALKRAVASAIVGGARARDLTIESDKAVYLLAPAEQLMIVSAPIAALHDQELGVLLKGESPILFVYCSALDLRNGAHVPEGFYAVYLKANRELAEFRDAQGKTVGTGSLTMGARPSGGSLERKRVSLDVEGPELCYEVCVKVCLTAKIDAPGPINPEFRVCIEVIVKV